MRKLGHILHTDAFGKKADVCTVGPHTLPRDDDPALYLGLGATELLSRNLNGRATADRESKRDLPTDFLVSIAPVTMPDVVVDHLLVSCFDVLLSHAKISSGRPPRHPHLQILSSWRQQQQQEGEGSRLRSETFLFVLIGCPKLEDLLINESLSFVKVPKMETRESKNGTSPKNPISDETQDTQNEPCASSNASYANLNA